MKRWRVFGDPSSKYFAVDSKTEKVGGLCLLCRDQPKNMMESFWRSPIEILDFETIDEYFFIFVIIDYRNH